MEAPERMRFNAAYVLRKIAMAIDTATADQPALGGAVHKDAMQRGEPVSLIVGSYLVGFDQDVTDDCLRSDAAKAFITGKVQ